MNLNWTTIDVDGAPMKVRGCVTEQADAPAVILYMHAPGVDRFMEAMAQRLAQAGYAAYVPDLYYRQGQSEEGPLERMGRLRDAELEADVAAVQRHVADRGHRRIAAAGFCMGGRIALIAASVLPSLDAVVSFYGGFIRESWGEGAPPIARAASITCPAFLIGGKEDTNPSPDDITALSNALDAEGNPPQVSVFDDVGHAFLNFSRPGYRDDIAMRAWREFERFLSIHLRGASLKAP